MAGGRTDGLIKNFVAGAAIIRRRFVKFGASDTTILLAAAATDAAIGVSSEIDAAQGERSDVMMSDIAEVEYGGAVTRGDFLTSDAVGRAVTAAPAAGANVRVHGQAMVSGVLGDIGSVHIAPSVMQG